MFLFKMHFSTHTAALKVHSTNNSLLDSAIALKDHTNIGKIELKLSSQNNAMADILMRAI